MDWTLIFAITAVIANGIAFWCVALLWRQVRRWARLNEREESLSPFSVTTPATPQAFIQEVAPPPMSIRTGLIPSTFGAASRTPMARYRKASDPCEA